MGTQASSQLGSEDIDHRSYSPTYRFIIFPCRRFHVRFLPQALARASESQ